MKYELTKVPLCTQKANFKNILLVVIILLTNILLSFLFAYIFRYVPEHSDVSPMKLALYTLIKTHDSKSFYSPLFLVVPNIIFIISASAIIQATPLKKYVLLNSPTVSRVYKILAAITLYLCLFNFTIGRSIPFDNYLNVYFYHIIRPFKYFGTLFRFDYYYLYSGKLKIFTYLYRISWMYMVFLSMDPSFDTDKTMPELTFYNNRKKTSVKWYYRKFENYDDLLKHSVEIIRNEKKNIIDLTNYTLFENNLETDFNIEIDAETVRGIKGYDIVVKVLYNIENQNYFFRVYETEKNKVESRLQLTRRYYYIAYAKEIQ